MLPFKTFSHLIVPLFVRLIFRLRLGLSLPIQYQYGILLEFTLPAHLLVLLTLHPIQVVDRT